MAAPEIRPLTDADVDAAVELSGVFFLERLSSGERARRRELLAATPGIGAFDDGALVGVTAAFPLTLAVPGGELACAGVTFTGVAPTHRRRGLLTAMLTRLLDDAVGAGQPLAALWAAESAIYGRYGFGAATRRIELDLHTRAPLDWRIEPDPRPLRLVDPAEAPALLAPIQARSRRPGSPARDERWWRLQVLRAGGAPADEEAQGPLRVAVLADAGYVVYRAFDGALWVGELVGDTPAVEAALWRYVASIDLVTRVRAETRPVDDPLDRMLVAGDDAARTTRTADALWLRLLDVGAALSARAWATDVAVTVEVADARRPANAGRWRIERDGTERTDAPADLALDVRELSAAYLGGVALNRLAAAGLIDERRDGAVAELDAALRTERPPFCPDHF